MNPPLPNHGMPMPSREMVTDQQFKTVLDIVQGLQPYLLLTQRELESGIPLSLDGGVTASAAVTMMKACERMDQMLNDASRWTLKENDALYDAMTKHFTVAAETNQKKIEEILQSHRPSSRMQPTFIIIKGEYIAFWGATGLPGGMILGRGPTPEAALKDFDEAFLRDAPNQLHFAKESEERLNGGEKTEGTTDEAK